MKLSLSRLTLSALVAAAGCLCLLCLSGCTAIELLPSPDELVIDSPAEAPVDQPSVLVCPCGCAMKGCLCNGDCQAVSDKPDSSAPVSVKYSYRDVRQCGPNGCSFIKEARCPDHPEGFYRKVNTGPWLWIKTNPTKEPAANLSGLSSAAGTIPTVEQGRSRGRLFSGRRLFGGCASCGS